MSVHFDPTRPIYLQIMEEVKRRTARGEYTPGQQLPSVRDMAVQVGVNPNTMGRAYQELEREGFIETRRGEGSFITGDAAVIAAQRASLAAAARERFTQEIRSLGLDGAQIAALLAQIQREVGVDG